MKYNVAKQNATGEWHVSRWTYDSSKWAVYHPCGTCVAVWDTKKEAEKDCQKKKESEP